MAFKIVIGAQWGDEGKGKIVDVLSEDADWIVRYQGGNNAGHTVEVGDEKFVLHLIPSGILHEGKSCVIGNGVVLDASGFIDEIDGLIARGFTLDGRLSKIISDGYIDRASVDMDAYYLSAAYIGKKNSLRANVFSGHEITYQAWNGVPAQWVNDDDLRTFNVSGTDDLSELENPHDNEVDNYRQTHYQLLFVQEINKNWNLNLKLEGWVSM